MEWGRPERIACLQRESPTQPSNVRHDPHQLPEAFVVILQEVRT